MKLIIIASVIGVCAAARLEHLEPGYLPPGSQSSSFASTGSSGFNESNNGLNKGSGSFGGSVQSRSGATGGDAFGASSSSSPQFSSRNNFENIPQQAFDEETGYQYGPGVNNFRTAGASSGNQFGDASPSSSNLVQALNSRFNAPTKPEKQSQQFNGVNNFKTAAAPSQPAFEKNQLGVTSQISSNNAQSGVNSRFNAPNQQPQQFNGQESQTQQTDNNGDDDSISIQGQDQTSISKGPSTRYQSTQSGSKQEQSGVNSRFNTPSQQQPQQFNGQVSHNQQTDNNNDDDSDLNQSNQDQVSKGQGPSTRHQSTQSGSNKEQSGVNSRFNAPSQRQPQQFSQNQQSEDNDDNDSVFNQGQASTAQRPTTRYQPEQSKGNTFNQQNRGQEIRTQSNLGKQFAGRPVATSQFEVQSGSNQRFGLHSQPGFDRDSNTDASQMQSLTSRFNAPNEQFAAASQQIGANNAAGRQFGARFGAPKSQTAEPNPFRNIPQQAFDEKTGYIY